ncbi:hypothetical protein [Natronorubrum halophilum]|uniref:hypothetical protein n=1 Tax=Natronorubrum halophilum TaxID=1702106 RepID=UPI0037420BD3
MRAPERYSPSSMGLVSRMKPLPASSASAAISGFVGTLRAIEDIETVDYSLVPLDAVGQVRDA